MGRDAVDAAAHSLSTTTNAIVPESITDRVLLLGAEGYEARSNQRVALARRAGVHVSRIDHLLSRYGGLVDDLVDLLERRAELNVPLAGAEDHLAAEVVYAVSHEGAQHLDDVLVRRTRIATETFDRGVAAARTAADLMAAELGWLPERVDDEVDHYLRRVEAERLSQLKMTDQEADEARVRPRHPA